MNQIDKIRAELQYDLNTFKFAQGEIKESYSPDKRFKAICTNLLSKDVNYPLCKIDIYHEIDSALIFSFLCNEEYFFHAWLTATNTEYFICAEDAFGGITMVDLTNRQIAGYSPGEDRFICTDFSLSPSGKVLVTIGCYWACSYVIKVFDFSNPLQLPLVE